MPNAPTAVYGDGFTIGQLARHWDKPTEFVRGLIEDGKLWVDERGCIPIDVLHIFYRENAHPLGGEAPVGGDDEGEGGAV